jgi:hypothetical protein
MRSDGCSGMFRNTFGSGHPERAERLASIGRISLECLARSDALYHTVEHTLLVTLVGLDILRGRSLSDRIEPDDFSHVLVACLLHDIGYVRGVLRGDRENSFIISEDGETVTLPRGASVRCFAWPLPRYSLENLCPGATGALADPRRGAGGAGYRIYALSMQSRSRRSRHP